MRRLITALCALGTLLVATTGQTAASAAPAQPGDHVDVVSVSGLIDPVQADFITKAVHTAETGQAEVLVIQLNSTGGLLSQAKTEALELRVKNATVPVAVWVGPSGRG